MYARVVSLWVVVAFKKEDKSKMEFSFDREKIFSSSTLVNNYTFSQQNAFQVITQSESFP